MLFVRPLSLHEAEQLHAGITSANPFTRRRCQILLASAEGEKATTIHLRLGCSHDAVREAIHAFHRDGLQSLLERRHSLRFIIDKSRAPAISEILQTSPRRFGKKKRHWTLELLAEVCCEQGVTARVISREGMRQAIGRLGIQWPLSQQKKPFPASPYLSTTRVSTKLA